MRRKHPEKEKISHKVARLQAKVLAFVMATICGLIVFIMTAWLLIKGGENVGAHLKLLGQYFIGYSVSWPGAIVGLIYGVLVGGIIGWIIGIIYNLIVGLRRQ
jgi:multisubunit Na+/H+ antiporter MnhB subunit